MNHVSTKRPAAGWRLLLALSFFALINTLLWALTIPPDHSPDETGHFNVVRFEATHHRIPEVGVDTPAATVTRDAAGHLNPDHPFSAQPGLSYIVDAVLVALSGARGVAAYRWARIPGILSAGAMPLIVFWAARRMTSRQDVAMFAAMLTAAWPQLTFVLSYVNNDGLTIVLSAAAIGSWYAGLSHEWRWRDVVLSASLTGLLLINKQNGFFVAVGTPLALLFTMRAPRKGARLAAAAAIIVALSSWWYAIAAARYGTDLFASRRAAAALARLHAEWSSGRQHHIGFLTMLFGRPFPFYASWVGETARSGFAAFGGMDIWLPDVCYGIALFFFLAALVGMRRAVAGAPEPGRSPMLQAGGGVHKPGRTTVLHWLTAAAFFSMVLAAASRSWSFSFQPQGRHLFPMLMPFLAMLALGLLSLFEDPGPRRRVVLGVSLTLVVINVTALLFTLVDRYTAGLESWFATFPFVIVVWSVTLVALAITMVQAWSAGSAVQAGS